MTVGVPNSSWGNHSHAGKKEFWSVQSILCVCNCVLTQTLLWRPLNACTPILLNPLTFWRPHLRYSGPYNDASSKSRLGFSGKRTFNVEIWRSPQLMTRVFTFSLERFLQWCAMMKCTLFSFVDDVNEDDNFWSFVRPRSWDRLFFLLMFRRLIITVLILHSFLIVSYKLLTFPFLSFIFIIFFRETRW